MQSRCHDLSIFYKFLNISYMKIDKNSTVFSCGPEFFKEKRLSIEIFQDISTIIFLYPIATVAPLVNM